MKLFIMIVASLGFFSSSVHALDCKNLVQDDALKNVACEDLSGAAKTKCLSQSKAKKTSTQATVSGD